MKSFNDIKIDCTIVALEIAIVCTKFLRYCSDYQYRSFINNKIYAKIS